MRLGNRAKSAKLEIKPLIAEFGWVRSGAPLLSSTAAAAVEAERKAVADTSEQGEDTAGGDEK
jgi:hypothetical protein